MSLHLIAVGRPDVPALPMPERFRHEIAYFMSLPDAPGAPQLGANEYWIPLDNARRWLDEGAFSIVSPLDSEHQAVAELTEDQERWLEWLVTHKIEHIRFD